jgi:hypothetical protein
VPFPVPVEHLVKLKLLTCIKSSGASQTQGMGSEEKGKSCCSDRVPFPVDWQFHAALPATVKIFRHPLNGQARQAELRASFFSAMIPMHR